MSDTSVLDALRERLAAAQAKLAAAQAQAAEYQAKAEEIGRVYQDLKEKKDSMKALKGELEDFREQKYGYWKGTLWKDQYKTAVDGVCTSYETVIGEIDTNLDALNWEKTGYENKAAECFGLVGQLAGTVNNIKTSIQNWWN